MKVYHRLCVGLRGSSHQAVELMCSLCVHWASRFLATSQEDTESYCTPTRAQLVALTQTDTELNGFVALFSLIMRESVEALEAPGFHKEGDILVCLIFCLLANGTIQLTEVKKSCLYQFLHDFLLYFRASARISGTYKGLNFYNSVTLHR